MARVQFGNVGDGDVVGPTSATDNAVAVFDSITGKIIKNSLVIINASGDVNIPAGRKYYIGGSQLAVADVYGAAPLLSPTFIGVPYLTTTPPVGNNSHMLADTAFVLTNAGNVFGPATGGPNFSTDHAIARYNGITGRLLLNSGATIDDSGNISAPSVISHSFTAPSSGNLLIDSLGVSNKIIFNVLASVDNSGNFVAPSVSTTPATAHVTLSGTSISADGTDTNINLALWSKGSGKIYLNNVLYVPIEVRRGYTSSPASSGTVTFSPAFAGGVPTVVAMCNSMGNTVIITGYYYDSFTYSINHSCQGCNVPASDTITWIAVYY